MARGRRLGTVAAAALVLGGCSMGDVELNGKIFDWMGVSTASLASKKEPQLAPRQGLVVPPSVDRLPVPGSEQEATAEASWPQDPDQVKAQRAVAQGQTVQNFCRERDWFERAKPEEFNRITQNGSLCSTVSTVINSQIDKPKPAPAR